MGGSDSVCRGELYEAHGRHTSTSPASTRRSGQRSKRLHRSPAAVASAVFHLTSPAGYARSLSSRALLAMRMTPNCCCMKMTAELPSRPGSEILARS